jgi:hypothetical protein
VAEVSDDQPTGQRAIVAFYDPEGARWRWLLKPGFRHVLAAIDDGTYWVMIDAAEGRPVFQVLQTSDYDLAGFWRAEGMTVVETVQGPPVEKLAWAHNCVGLVKAAICIPAPFAITPHQLYKHLTRPK